MKVLKSTLKLIQTRLVNQDADIPLVLASLAVALHDAATAALAAGVPLSQLDLVPARRALARRSACPSGGRVDGKDSNPDAEPGVGPDGAPGAPGTG